MNRRLLVIQSLSRLVLGTAGVLALAASAVAQTQTHYVRYEAAGRASWGILEGETIRELQGSIFDGAAKPSGRTMKLAAVKLLPPAEPKKVIAAGCGTRFSCCRCFFLPRISHAVRILLMPCAAVSPD
jgi:hypothetical protein